MKAAKLEIGVRSQEEEGRSQKKCFYKYEMLLKRRQLRRARRDRKTQYCQPRFDNRKRPTGSLPPSLLSRVENRVTWVLRLQKLGSISDISQELVKFDTQQMDNPDICGVSYEQGELAGYEVREFLLFKLDLTCIYCGAKDTGLEIEHLLPKSKGGSNRISDLGIACRNCHQKKGNRDLREFLAKKPHLLQLLEAYRSLIPQVFNSLL